MKQKGFATIFGLCLILVVALIVKGIQEAEANHAREVSNFELEQALQSAAESGIIEAAELVRGQTFSKGTIFTTTKTFKNGEQTINITVEVKGERGKIYVLGSPNAGIYLMSRATTKVNFLSENVYRRAYAYVLDAADTKIIFMELPTLES